MLLSFFTSMTNKMCMILWSVDIPLQFCKYFVAAVAFTTHTHSHTDTLMRRHSSYNRLTNTLHTWVSMSVCVWACVHTRSQLPHCAAAAGAASWYNFKRMFRALLSIWHNGRASSEGFDLSGCCCCCCLASDCFYRLPQSIEIFLYFKLIFIQYAQWCL